MRFDAGEVFLQEFLLCFRIVGVDGFEIIIKRNFGIDDNIAVFRQMDNNIRAVKPFVFVIIRFLRVVILPFAQTGTFQKPVKLEFPPVALCLFVAFKRFGQALGVFAEILVQRHQVHQLGIKAGLAFYAFFPGAGNFRLKSLKLLGKRRQQRRKRGFLLGGKRLVLSFDDFVGNVLKFQRQFFFYLFQIADFFSHRFFPGGGSGFLRT